MYSVPRRKPVLAASPPLSSCPRDSSAQSLEELDEDSQTYFIDASRRQSYSLGHDEAESRLARHKTAYQRVEDVDEGGPKRTVSHHLDAFTILADCAVILVPAAMTVFVIMVWRLHGQEYEDESLPGWRNGITIISTAFPIIFAAIVGRLLSATAHWKLEQGAPIGLLETLMGSRTVGSTFITLLRLRALKLRAIFLINVGLVLLWSISPIGAQSFLRMLSTEERVEQMLSSVAYYDLNKHPSDLGAVHKNGWGPELYPYYESIMTSVYTTLFLTPASSMRNPMDLWGNIKIPFLEQTDGSDDQHWRSAGTHALDAAYASLLGIPFNDTLPYGNTSFLLESSYLDLTCDYFTKDNIGDPPTIHYPSSVFKGVSGSFNGSEVPNGTWWGTCPHTALNCSDYTLQTKPWSVALDTFVDEYWERKMTSDPVSVNHSLAHFVGEQGIEATEATLLFEAKSNPSPSGKSSFWHRYATTCKVQQVYVQSRVDCTKTPQAPKNQPGCAVVAQRPSTLPHPPGNISLLSFPRVFIQLSEKMPGLASGGGGTAADMALQYLYKEQVGAWLHVPLDEVSPAVFGRRLSQLLNTFLGATQMKLAATAGPVPASSLVGPDEQVLDTVTERFREYVRVSRPWVVACLTSCLVLLASGLASVVLMHRVRGPDVLGYVSSSVRDSRHVEMPDEIRDLDGLDASRLVQERRIRLGVVQAHGGNEALLVGIGDEVRVEKMK